MRIFMLAGALAIAGAAPAAAAPCVVDVGGALGIPGAFASTNAALAACNGAGTVIEIRCPMAGCTDTNVVIGGRTGVTVRSSELDGTGGPVGLLGVNNQPALEVWGSSSITVSGIASFTAQQIAVWVTSSQVQFGTVASTAPIARYTTFSAPSIGMLVDGASNVTATRAGFNDSGAGISIATTAAGAPFVQITGAAFLRNDIAARIAGPQSNCAGVLPPPATLELRGDTTAWLNYVFENHEGFDLFGRSVLRIDHGVLANNLDQVIGPFNNAYLFHVANASWVEVRNALIYDNDATPNLTPPYAGGGMNTASIIYSSTSCAQSSFAAATIVNNAADLIFNIGGNGLLALDHVAIAGNYAKVLSMSGYYVHHGSTCPPLALTAVAVWNNKMIADPVACLPASLMSWNPNAVPNNPPRTLASYPAIDPPLTANHLINRLEPTMTAPPAGLFSARPWSVDGIAPEDTVRLDVGYHNPR